MTFDPTKPVQLRDGSKARVICTDRKSSTSYSIVALVSSGSGELAVSRRVDGRLGEDEDPLDLVNIPVEEVRYTNVYPRSTGGFFETLTEANANRSSTYCGTLRLTFSDNVLIKAEKL